MPDEAKSRGKQESDPGITHSLVNERAYRNIRADIVAGRQLPGARLRFDKLREDYGVSFTALREALSRLTSEGLVEVESRKGARVAPVNTADLRDLISVRLVIETECLRRSIECGDEAWEARVVSAFHLYANLLKGGEHGQEAITTRVARHQQFHEALVSACDSPRLLALRQMLAAQAQRYLTLSYQTYSLDPVKGAREHDQLMRASLERRASLAVALLSEDIEEAARHLFAAMKKNEALGFNDSAVAA